MKSSLKKWASFLSLMGHNIKTALDVENVEDALPNFCRSRARKLLQLQTGQTFNLRHHYYDGKTGRYVRLINNQI